MIHRKKRINVQDAHKNRKQKGFNPKF